MQEHRRGAAQPPERRVAELGRRIADHRLKLGWTQQQLAERLSISRVAVSHLESGASPPAERTVALLAGVFKVDPLELVAGTDYPEAKAERLPLVTARHTEVEHQLALLEADLRWCDEVPGAHADQVMAEWEVRLRALQAEAADPAEGELVAQAAERLRRRIDEALRRRQ